MANKKKQPEAKPVQQAEQAPANERKDFFASLGKKAPLIAVGAVLLIAFLVYRDYLLFNKAFFFKDIGSDSYNYSYPYLYHVADYIAQHGLPSWSFQLGMGQSLFPFFLRDVFDIFLFAAGKDHIMYGTAYKELAKILLTGITFFYYLKTIRLSDYVAIIGAMLFSFCGFMVVGGGWFLFSFETFNFALLLLGFERLHLRRQWQWFTLAIVLICVSQPFNLYVYGLFIAIYAVFRHLQEQAFDGKKLGLLFVFMAAFGLLAMLISSPFLIENIVQIMESPRGSGSTSYTKVLSGQPMFATADGLQFGSAMLRMFSSDMLGTGSDFKGWQNYLEAPMFYCGILCLVLVPQVFQFLERRVRIVFAVFLALWILPVIFPWFRYAFWLFSGDYYRAYSIVVSVVLVYYSVTALEMIIQRRKINLVVLIVTVAGLFLLMNYPYFPDIALNPSVSVAVALFVVVYGALLFFMGRQGEGATFRYVLFAVVIAELSFLSSKSVNDRDPITPGELAERVGYNDYTVEAINSVKNDKSFYRVDKNYYSSPAIHASLNDAMVQGYRGTMAYNPFNQVYYIYYLQLMGISEKGNEIQSRWATGLAGRPILESENQVKYMLARKQMNPLWTVMGDTIGHFGDVQMYRNKYLLPLGYTYDKYIKQSVFETLSTTQRDFVSLMACVVKDEDAGKVGGMQPFNLNDTIPMNAFSFDLYAQRVKALAADSLSVTKMTETSLAGKVTTSTDKMLYLSIPYDGGWQLQVDGKPAEKRIVFAGMTGVMLPKGSHTVDVVFQLRYYSKGVIMAFMGMVIFLAIWLFDTRAKKKRMAAL